MLLSSQLTSVINFFIASQVKIHARNSLRLQDLLKSNYMKTGAEQHEQKYVTQHNNHLLCVSKCVLFAWKHWKVKEKNTEQKLQLTTSYKYIYFPFGSEKKLVFPSHYISYSSKLNTLKLSKTLHFCWHSHKVLFCEQRRHGREGAERKRITSFLLSAKGEVPYLHVQFWKRMLFRNGFQIFNFEKEEWMGNEVRCSVHSQD